MAFAISSEAHIEDKSLSSPEIETASLVVRDVLNEYVSSR
jgi:hypothetical protein